MFQKKAQRIPVEETHAATYRVCVYDLPKEISIKQKLEEAHGGSWNKEVWEGPRDRCGMWKKFPIKERSQESPEKSQESKRDWCTVLIVK